MGDNFRSSTKDLISVSSRHLIKASSVKCMNIMQKQKVEALKEEYDNFVLVQWENYESSPKRSLNAYDFKDAINTEAFCMLLKGIIDPKIIKNRYEEAYETYKRIKKSKNEQNSNIIYSTSHSYRYSSTFPE